MPITAVLAIIAAASMAGLPGLNGFLSKEMMLEEAAHTVYAGQAWLFPVFATIGGLLSAAYSARLDFRCLSRAQSATIILIIRTTRRSGCGCRSPC